LVNNTCKGYGMNMKSTESRNIGTITVRQREAGDCPHMQTCAFMNKYRPLMELYCLGMERVYCRGAKQQQCARLRQFAMQGRFPDADISPTGDKIVAR